MTEAATRQRPADGRGDVAAGLHAALVAALGELTEIVADESADTGQYKYRYATLAGIMRAVRPVLAGHQLAVSQQLAGDEGTIAVQTVLEHESGATHASGWLTVKAPATAQQIGSWVSYLRRYQLVALLGLAIEDDDGRSGGAPGAAAPPPSPAMTDTQRTLLQTLFRQLGLEGPEHAEARAALITETVGDGLATQDEATVLIRALRRRVAEREEHGRG